MKYLITLILISTTVLASFAQTRRMNAAFTSSNLSVETQNQTVLPLLQKAEKQFRLFDYDATFLTLENAIAQDPFSADALLMRARFRKMVGMNTEAEADLELANSINPLAANLYGYYGNSGLLKVLSIEPQNAISELSTFQKLNYYYQAIDKKRASGETPEMTIQSFEVVIEDMENENFIDALDKLDEILKTSPESAIAYDLKGMILKKQGNFGAAVDAFSKAVTLDPNFAIAWYNFAQIEKSLGHFDKAKTYLDRAIELQEGLTKAYFERALLHKKMGEREKALEDYDKIIDMNGDTYMKAYLNRGLTKKMLGDYGGAMADLNQAIEEFPNNAELRKNRGNINLLFGLPRKAIDDYSKAIELNGDYAEAYYNRAMAFYLLYDKVSGCYDLEKSMDLGYEKAFKAKQYFCTQY